MPYSLAEIAGWVDATVVGDSSLNIDGVASLATAGPGDLAFLAHPRYQDELDESEAGAVLVGKALERDAAVPAQLVVDDPRRALATILERFQETARPVPGIDPTAVVAVDADVDPAATVGPLCVIGSRARIAAGAHLVGQVSIGAGAEVGVDSVLFPFVCVYDCCRIGERVRLHSGVVIGGDGFGYASDAEGHHKLPHLGIAVIEDDVEIGANSTVDRALLDQTVVGAGTKIDNLVQVGHNARLGRANVIVAGSMIAGSVTLGDRVVMGGHAGVAGHLKVGDDVQIASNASLHEDAEPGSKWGGIPAIPLMEWKRLSVHLRRLAELEKRVAELERQAGETDDD